MNHMEYVNGLFGLEGHVGIVTGASRGLGMGVAKVLTEAGATVYNLDVIPRGDDEKIGGNMIDVQVDLLDREATKKVIDEIAAKEGHLDFLINNAGITFKCRAEEFPMDRYRKIQDLNLETVFEISRMCYPYLKKSEYVGRILSISSMAAHMGFTGVVPYCMTKSGILGLTRGLAEEWKDDNILVNSIAPGWFLTKLNGGMFAENPDREKAALAKPMLGRFGYPVEIGYMALFLLSQASTYLTGQDFAVDGGALSHGF
ncbi:MAG: SDR family NAD(P)-dependent oxidoreductase [Blautia sp.]